MNLSSKTTIIKLAFVVLISIIYSYQLSIRKYIVPSSDAFDYLLTTEAIVNHGSINLQAQDLKTLRQDYSKKNNWDNFAIKQWYNTLELEVVNNPSQNNYSKIFFKANNGKYYNYHFCTLSYVNVPVRYITKFCNINPFYSYLITNILLILATLCVLLFVGKYGTVKHLLIGSMFLCSAIFWYMDWMHPEVFIMCGVAAGLWLYFNKHSYWGIFLLALVASQAQPLGILLACLCFDTLINNKINVKNVALISVSACVAVVPSMFYYINFGVTNLIQDMGFLSWKVVNYTRVFGFFFDLNQGMILTIPLLLIVYIGLWLYSLYATYSKKTAFTALTLFPLFILATVLVCCTMTNWNHGQTIINRYATYISITIMMHCIYLINVHVFNNVFKTAIYTTLLLTQAATTYYHSTNANTFYGDAHLLKPIAKWVLGNYPQYYNPDPQILNGRIDPNVFFNRDYYYSAVFTNDSNELCKIVVNVTKLNDLKIMGFTNAQIVNLKKEAIYLSNDTTTNYTLFNKTDTLFLPNYCYINRNILIKHVDALTLLKIEEKYAQKRYLNKVKQSLAANRLNKGIVQQEQKKAREWGYPFDVILLIDADYIQPNTPSKAFKAKKKLSYLMLSKELLPSFIIKAKDWKTPIGDVMLSDTDYLLNLQPN
jgi:hypothetical protein